MLNDTRGTEVAEVIIVAAIIAATIITVLYSIYTTLGQKLSDLLNGL